MADLLVTSIPVPNLATAVPAVMTVVDDMPNLTGGPLDVDVRFSPQLDGGL